MSLTPSVLSAVSIAPGVIQMSLLVVSLNNPQCWAFENLAGLFSHTNKTQFLKSWLENF